MCHAARPPQDNSEVRFQEAQADVSVEDLVQMQYEVPDEDEEGEEYMEGGDMEGGMQGMHGGGPMQDEGGDAGADEQSPEEARKVAILLELLSSGADLDAKVAQFRDDIDADLLSLLQQRLDTARAYDASAGIPSGVVERLEEMYRLLKLAYQRAEASPAMRLLDDVLDMLGDAEAAAGERDPFAPAGDDAGADDAGIAEAYYSARRAAASRMRSAFTGGVDAGVDIFAAAAALAASGPLAAEELSVEYVRLHEFVGETTELLDAAKARQTELGQVIARAARETQYEAKQQAEQRAAAGASATSSGGGRSGGGASARPSGALAERLQQLALARMAYTERQQGIAQLEDVLFLAKAMDSPETPLPQ